MQQFIENYEWLIKFVPVVAITLGVWQIYCTRRKAKWGKITTSCRYSLNIKYEGDRVAQTAPAYIEVEASNLGPGEVTISALIGKYKDGSTSSIPLGGFKGSLGMGDSLKRTIMPLEENGKKFDGFYNENNSELVDLWFEDTYGRKHKLKNVKNYLKEICKFEKPN